MDILLVNWLFLLFELSISYAPYQNYVCISYISTQLIISARSTLPDNSDITRPHL
jgi:hypothetical protein